MSSTVNCRIVRVTKDNYHQYNDMVFWRLNGKERTMEEKDHNKKRAFDKPIEQLSRDGFFVYAAEVNSRFVGWVHFIYMPKLGRWNKGLLYVDELWVVPDYRRKNIGTQLVMKINEIIDTMALETVRLYTDNPAAQKLYEKCGFETVNYCVFMEKEINGNKL